MQDELEKYLKSPLYQQDLIATSEIWGKSEVFGISGMFIFCSYITIPKLTAVHPRNNLPRSHTLAGGLAGEHEKRLLQRMLGLSSEQNWQGGIRNLRVRNLLLNLRQHHFELVGMRQEFMQYFACIIAISVLRAYSTFFWPIDKESQECYWRYISQTVLLLGVSLDEQECAQQHCQTFIDMYTQVTPTGILLLEPLLEKYPKYLQKSLPVLFPTTRLAVQSLSQKKNVELIL
ncbi:MAG TPA: hypothetical protein VEP90_01295 [Methylomirabilota bacterium]|nr:hypothetical protein [Methylomirabilota bacterium]